ncbi:CCA tRNA nucleotidyltransferase [Limnoraphis robusta Tam1]|uniref:CCA tRNA nucleotidyltransferase n=1 Tax=Limnoraphis robusta TaxID=1118279 RepID=UPI002B20A28A|nr:CCA tRNA nucleotidyltransferase [Limnoraphis robusta]MEA5498683.1 CCA tRNA nucleotidyltransferase [Limnoraphis robusta BA-68 BA1]MEA5538413.1 CCA tRNA nucleotidyltransferase [Limnoraphis robusta Tam1]
MSKPFNSIWSTDTWPFDREWLPQPAYLVGGAVRDQLLGRKAEYLDLDFVLLEEAITTAKNIANYYKAGFVLLDAERQIARVVFPQATVDFAQAEGSSLSQDLQRRDFTINAIAYNPFTQDLIDPHQGQTDLKQRLIRMISPENLRDDPLRLLRGYRQAAQLGFQLEPQTQATIRQLAPFLTQVAVERVQTELGYLLNVSGKALWIKQAIEDGLLSSFFPNASQHFDRLLEIDPVAERLNQQSPTLTLRLSHPIRDTLKTSLLALAKLTCLLSPDPAVAEVELTQLKYSKTEIRAAIALIKGLSSLQQTSPPQISLRQQYFLFQEVGTLFPALAVQAVAWGLSIESLSPLIERFLNPDDRVAHPQLLITGNELMAGLNLSPSPKIGQLLMKIQLAQVEGQISTAEQALKFAAQSLEHGE